jgi:hypothetical protein
MTLNPSGHAINRMPRRKRSRQHIIVGVSARTLRRAQEAIDRKDARKATTVEPALANRIDQGNIR